MRLVSGKLKHLIIHTHVEILKQTDYVIIESIVINKLE